MFRTQPTRSLLRFRATRPVSRTLPTTSLRTFTTTLPTYARKGAEDKDSLEPRRSENSLTGNDDAGAHSDAAFDPNNTAPEGEKADAEKQSGGAKNNPLDVSGGNKDVSKPRSTEEGKPEKSPRTSASGGGSAPKAGGVKSG
jgi:hypothetical protein